MCNSRSCSALLLLTLGLACGGGGGGDGEEVVAAEEQPCGDTVDYGFDGTIDETDTFRFDDRGLPTSLETDTGLDGSIDELTVFEWDAEERLTRRTHTIGVTLSFDELWRYDADGLVTYGSWGDEYSYVTTFYEYDAQGRATRDVVVAGEQPAEVAPAAGEWRNETTYFYANDRLDHTELRFEEGPSERVSTYVYEDDLVVRVDTRRTLDDVLVGDVSYVRDPQGRPISTTSRTLGDGEPTVDYEADWTYEPGGHLGSSEVQYGEIYGSIWIQELNTWVGDRRESYEHRSTSADGASGFELDNLFECASARRGAGAVAPGLRSARRGPGPLSPAARSLRGR